MSLSRRGLIGAIICAPAIVRASSLMPIKSKLVAGDTIYIRLPLMTPAGQTFFIQLVSDAPADADLHIGDAYNQLIAKGCRGEMIRLTRTQSVTLAGNPWVSHIEGFAPLDANTLSG